MKGLSVLRRRLKPPEATSPRKSPSRRSATVSAVTLSLTALKESADAFPPLKSAVAGVLHILELSRKVKTNKEECQRLSSRVQEILDQIAVAVPDATCLSPELHARIDKFTRILAEIEVFMETLCRTKLFKRFLYHKENTETLAEFNRQLDDELKLFMLISTINIEMSVSQQGARLEELTVLIHGNQKTQKRFTLLVVLFD